MIVIETPVFIFAGFMESGKTTALQGSLLRNSGPENQKSVILCTEDGERQYDREALNQKNVEVLMLEDEDALTSDYLDTIAEDYTPENVFVEFNGMWNLRAFLRLELPEGWYIANVFCLVDASTYQLFLNNMRQTIMEPLREADVILFNRCQPDFPKGEVRRTLKLLNGHAEIFFANLDGKVEDGVEELLLPNADGIIDVTDDLFCSWFVDTLENTEGYYGQKVRFRGVVSTGNGLKKNQFYIGRLTAICCEADAQFVGFIAETEGKAPAKGQWLDLEAEIQRGIIDGKHQIILLKVIALEPVPAPDQIFLYF